MCLNVERKNGLAEAYVCYGTSLPPAHQEHIKTHELAHIALGHPMPVLKPKRLHAIMRDPTKAIGLAQEICCRANDPRRATNEQLMRDQEAERLTRLIYQHMLVDRHKRRLERNSSQDDLDNFLHRLGID